MSRSDATVVLIHGGTGTSATWRALLPQLESPAVAIDLPGRPGAPCDHREVSLAGNARNVLARLDEAGIERAHLVGHSLGGATLLAFAALAPERATSLVFVACPVPEDHGTVHSAVGEAAQAFVGGARERGETTLPVPPRLAKEQHGAGIESVPEAVAPFFDPVPVHAVRNVADIHYVRTSRDTALAPQLQDRSIENLRRFTAVTTHDCDAEHMIMIEDPRRLAAIIGRIAGGRAERA